VVFWVGSGVLVLVLPVASACCSVWSCFRGVCISTSSPVVVVGVSDLALQHCSFGGSGDSASLAPVSVSGPRSGLLVSMVLMAFSAAPTVLVFGLCVLFIYVLFV
jgi:hypothetical protein